MASPLLLFAQATSVAGPSYMNYWFASRASQTQAVGVGGERVGWVRPHGPTALRAQEETDRLLAEPRGHHHLHGRAAHRADDVQLDEPTGQEIARAGNQENGDR